MIFFSFIFLSNASNFEIQCYNTDSPGNYDIFHAASLPKVTPWLLAKLEGVEGWRVGVRVDMRRGE